MPTDKQKICEALRAHIAQRSGLEAGNYFSDWRDKAGIAACRSDQRHIARDGREARELLAFVEGRDSITADDLERAFSRAFSGRLSLKRESGELVQVKTATGALKHVIAGSIFKLDYCTGQYFPTEYRAAACAVLASALWRYWADDGNDPRKMARQWFGREVQSRWFN